LRGGANTSYIRSFTYELLNTAAGRAAQDRLDPVYGTDLKSSFTTFISVSFAAKNCVYTDTSVALVNGIPTFYFPCVQVRERPALCCAAAAAAVPPTDPARLLRMTRRTAGRRYASAAAERDAVMHSRHHRDVID
jgi:hypothetical protein